MTRDQQEKGASAIRRRTIEGWTGDAALYELDPPLAGHHHVIVSAITCDVTGVPETYIFPAHADGRLISWDQLDGSMKDTLRHEDALRAAGYEVLHAA